MPASDFEAITVPNIGAIGRMAPVSESAEVLNAGTNWWSFVYTVPAERVLALDWATFVVTAGLLPAVLHIKLWNAPNPGWPLRQAPAGLNQPATIHNTIWLPSTTIIHFQIEGGDATTGVLWSLSGRLFDWTDFES